MLTRASGPRTLSRWLVLVVLSLTLPLQGALAVTMGIGMALMPVHAVSGVPTMPMDCHEMLQASPAHASAKASPGGHGWADDAVTVDAHDRSLHADEASETHEPPAADDSQHADEAHCGICLQCCIGAALLLAPLTPAVHGLTDAAPARVTVAVPEQLPQSLDRPPKPRLN